MTRIMIVILKHGGDDDDDNDSISGHTCGVGSGRQVSVGLTYGYVNLIGLCKAHKALWGS